MHGGRRTFSGGRKRGQVIVMFTVILLVLLGFAAIGIDVGYLYVMRHEIQRSVDAGALAGASVFIGGIWDNTDLSQPGMVKAVTRAREYATQDLVGANPLTIAEITVSFPDQDRIQVSAQRAANLFFGSIFGSGTKTVGASATAMAEPVLQNLKCPIQSGPFRSPLAPLAVPYPYTDADNDNTYDAGEPVFVTCIPANRSGTLCQGGHMTLPVADTPPTGGGGYPGGIPGYIRDFAGEIFPVVICGDNPESESDLTNRIADPCGRPCTTLVSLNDTLVPKPDQTFDPTIDGMEELIDDDSSASWDPGPNLPNSPNPMYSDNNWLMSPRVMNVMLYDPQEASASGMITVRGFAGFWIEAVPSSPSTTNRTISGYLVPDSASGETNTTVHFEPSLKTTRLVQ